MYKTIVNAINYGALPQTPQGRGFKLNAKPREIDGVVEKELIDAILEMSMRENTDLYEKKREACPPLRGGCP